MKRKKYLYAWVICCAFCEPQIVNAQTLTLADNVKAQKADPQLIAAIKTLYNCNSRSCDEAPELKNSNLIAPSLAAI